MSLKQKEIDNLKLDLKLPKGNWLVLYIGEYSLKGNNTIFVKVFLRLLEDASGLDIISREIRQNLMAILGEGCIIQEDYTVISAANRPGSKRLSFETKFDKAKDYASSPLTKYFYRSVSDKNIKLSGRFYSFDNFIVPTHVISRYFFFCSTKAVDILFDSDLDQIIFPVKKEGLDEPNKGYVKYDNNKLNRSEAERIGLFFFEGNGYGQTALKFFKGFRNTFNSPTSLKIFLGTIPFKKKILLECVGESFRYAGKDYVLVQQITKHNFLETDGTPFTITYLETVPAHPKDSTKEKEDKDVRGYKNTDIDDSSGLGIVKITNENADSGPTQDLIIDIPTFMGTGITYTSHKRDDQFFKYDKKGDIIIPEKEEKTTDDDQGEKGKGAQKINVKLEHIMPRGTYIKDSVNWACNKLYLRYFSLTSIKGVDTFEIDYKNKYVYILEKGSKHTRIVSEASFRKLNSQEINNLTFRFIKADDRLNSTLISSLKLAIPSILLHASIRHETNIEDLGQLSFPEELKSHVIEKAGLKIKNYLSKVLSI